MFDWFVLLFDMEFDKCLMLWIVVVWVLVFGECYVEV